MRRYGKGIASAEFYLRRMTNLSLSLFWVVSAVSFEKARHPDGVYPAGELEVIRYLAEEAREVQARDGRLAPTRRELAHRGVMAAL